MMKIHTTGGEVPPGSAGGTKRKQKEGEGTKKEDEGERSEGERGGRRERRQKKEERGRQQQARKGGSEEEKERGSAGRAWRQERLRTEHRSETALGGGAEERRRTAERQQRQQQAGRKKKKERERGGRERRRRARRHKELAWWLPVPTAAQRVISKRDAAAESINPIRIRLCHIPEQSLKERLKVVDGPSSDDAVREKVIDPNGPENRPSSEVRGTKLKGVGQVPGVAPGSAGRGRARSGREEGGEVGRAAAEHGTVNDTEHSDISPTSQRGKREMKQRLFFCDGNRPKKTRLNGVQGSEGGGGSEVKRACSVFNVRQNLGFIQ